MKRISEPSVWQEIRIDHGEDSGLQELAVEKILSNILCCLVKPNRRMAEVRLIKPEELFILLPFDFRAEWRLSDVVTLREDGDISVCIPDLPVAFGSHPEKRWEHINPHPGFSRFIEHRWGSDNLLLSPLRRQNPSREGHWDRAELDPRLVGVLKQPPLGLAASRIITSRKYVF